MSDKPTRKRIAIPRAAGTNGGFAMVEAVTAFLILALGFGVLLGGLSMGLRTEQRAAEAALALMHAESLLAETGAAAAIKPGKSSGRLANGYRWLKEISLLPMPAGARVTPYKISISVTPPGNGAPVRLDTLRLGNDPSLDQSRP